MCRGGSLGISGHSWDFCSSLTQPIRNGPRAQEVVPLERGDLALGAQWKEGKSGNERSQSSSGKGEGWGDAEDAGRWDTRI